MSLHLITTNDHGRQVDSSIHEAPSFAPIADPVLISPETAQGWCATAVVLFVLAVVGILHLVARWLV